MYAYVCDSSTSTAYCTGTFEIMKVTSVGGSNALNVSRAQAGTSAVAHAAQKLLSNSPTSIYNLTLSQEVLAIETFLGINGANIPGSASGGIVPVVKGGTGVAAAQGAGTGTKVQLATGTTTTGNVPKFDSSGALIDSGVTANNAPYLYPSTYNFTAQTIGGSVSGGGSVAAGLTPCPLGVAGADTGHYLYVSGGTGTAEAVLISGGSCTSGAASGTINFTVANAHSGSWTLGSATAGWQEAENGRVAGAGSVVYATGGSYQFRAAVSYFDGATFVGAGPSTKIIPASSTADVFVNLTTQPAGDGVGSNRVSFKSFQIDGSSYTGVNGIHGIRMNLQNGTWQMGITGVKVSQVAFNNVRYAVYGERVNDVSVTDCTTYLNTAIWITDITGNPAYRNFGFKVSNLQTSYTLMDGSSAMNLAGYIITLDKCVACFLDGVNITGTLGNAGGIHVTHASEGVVISNYSVEMFGVSGNPYYGINLEETVWSGVTVAPTATQVSNAVIDMSYTAGLIWTASSFAATNLQVTNSLFTAHPTLGGVAGIEVNGTSLTLVGLNNNAVYGSWSQAGIWLPQAPKHITIQGGNITNSHATASCLSVGGGVDGLSVSDVICNATSAVALVDTYSVQSDRRYWNNSGTTPIQNLIHSKPANFTSELYTAGNAYARSQHGNLSGSTSDFFTLSNNFKRTTSAAGVVDQAGQGTAEIAIESVSAGAGLISIRAGVAGVAPSDVVLINNSGLALSGHLNGLVLNSDLVGGIALVAGTGTKTFGTAFLAAPVCVCSDSTANASVKCAATTTVLTATGTGTDVIKYACFGNPN